MLDQLNSEVRVSLNHLLDVALPLVRTHAATLRPEGSRGVPQLRTLTVEYAY